MLYAAGGSSINNNILNSVERYNFAKEKWESMPHMHHQRHNFVLLSIPKGLLAIGGHNGVNALADVEIFDFSTAKWQKMEPMKGPRCCFTVCLSRDYEMVTVFGGFNEGVELGSIEQLHIPSGIWSYKGTMREKRCLHASILSPL
jgi:N-acetylneuraminic acid mutarotase